MEKKKTKKANLENRKALYFQIGLVITLALVYAGLEYRSYDRSLLDLGTAGVRVDDEEVMITVRPPEAPPPPPPPAPQEQLVIAENDEEIEVEAVIVSAETTATEVIEIVQVEAVKEEEEEIFNFAVVEDKPVFPGCEKFAKDPVKSEECFNQKLQQFVGKNLTYPSGAAERNIQGRVFVKFIIQKDGTIGGVEVARGVDRELDEAAINLVKRIPKMKPASQRGKPVPVSYVLPVLFKLQ